MTESLALLSTPLWSVPERHARVRPHAIALRFEDEDLSWRRFASRIDQVAFLLWHRWGVRTGDRVAWLGLNHPEQLVLLFALARIGAALLPLNCRLAPHEWDQQLRDCTPTHLVHDAAWAGQAGALAARCALAVHSLGELRAAPSGRFAAAAGGADLPVLLVFTSGTSGRSRAAVHTQANLLANMRIASQVQQMAPEDRILTVLPLFHVGGLCIQTLPALYAGASVMLHARFSADACIAAIARERPTLTLQVPATMKALVEHPQWAQADLSCLRAVWAGSSVLPPPLVRAFLDRGVPLCNVYGATETGPFSIALPPEAASTHIGSCGWPAPGVEVRLQDAKAGVGELLVRGPNVVARYWPDRPACDAQGWFHSGDLATRADDGSFTVAGRATDLIISGGENIDPLEIETAVAAHPAVVECAVFGLPHPQWGEAVALAVVLRGDAQLSADSLAQSLQGRLARFKMPWRLFVVTALPKTALGKVQRQALASMAASGGLGVGSSRG